MYDYKAQKKYNAKNKKCFAISLHLKNDADCIQWLESQQNKQGAIKELIRKAINEEK